MEKSILAYPNFNKIFKLYMNASDIRLGAVFMQKNEIKKD